MSSWAIVAVVAIAVWGLLQLRRDRRRAPRDDDQAGQSTGSIETQREIEALRERIKVLERIATDGNSPSAQETKRIAAEIEALRDKQAD